MNMRREFLVFLAVFLASIGCSFAQKIGGEPLFSRVSLAFACDENTKAFDRLNLKSMSPAYDGSLAPMECADKGKMISRIIPEKVSIVEHKAIGSWTVVILFSERDAARLAALTKGPVQQRYLLIVDEKVLAAGFLRQQIQGEFGLDADSHEQASWLKQVFVVTQR